MTYNVLSGTLSLYTTTTAFALLCTDLGQLFRHVEGRLQHHWAACTRMWTEIPGVQNLLSKRSDGQRWNL